MKKEIRNNLAVYSALLVLAGAGIWYGHTLLDAYPSLRVWNWQNLLIMLAGIPFLFLMGKARLPGFWPDNIPAGKIVWVPALTGALFGILDILVFKIILHPEPYTSLPPFLQPFPYSILLYLSGAFEIEVFYRLIPLTLFLLAGKYLARGRYFNLFFWTGAVLTSLREPLEQLPEGGAWLILYSFLTGFLMNFLQALFFRKSGFLASLSVRLGHYLFWHILLGIWVEFAEL